MGAKRQNRWSAAVTHGSNALDLESGVFRLNDAHRIALSLKHSAEHSRRRKGTPFQSAMSMLNFYINRAGSRTSRAPKKHPDGRQGGVAAGVSQAASLDPSLKMKTMFQDKPLIFPKNCPDGKAMKSLTQALLDRRATSHFKPDPCRRNISRRFCNSPRRRHRDITCSHGGLSWCGRRKIASACRRRRSTRKKSAKRRLSSLPSPSRTIGRTTLTRFLTKASGAVSENLQMIPADQKTGLPFS